MEKLQEQKLRAFIRAGIIKKKKERLEEQFKQALNKNKLRSIIKNIVLQEATDVNTDTPNRSTGINVLATTLKLVIPIIKQGYEQLTSSPEQRKSFRAHVIQNAINTLVRVDLTTGSEEERRAGGQEGQARSSAGAHLGRGKGLQAPCAPAEPFDDGRGVGGAGGQGVLPGATGRQPRGVGEAGRRREGRRRGEGGRCR